MRSTGIRFSSALAWLCAAILCAPAVAPAADKDLIELQRQMAVLTDHVNSLQTAFGTLQNGMSEKLGGQGAMLQQTLDAVNQIRAANAAAAKTLSDALGQQEQKIAVPVAALTARIDQMIQAVSTAQENIADMNSRLGKMEQRLVDMENVMKALQSLPQKSNPDSPDVSAHSLYEDASRDQLSGKDELALQEYNEYLKRFGDTESAASAQFGIGQILFQQGKNDQAIQAFDIVAGQYPMSGKAPEALYQKALALKKAGQRSQATQVLNQLVRQYPGSDAAGRAKSDLSAATRK